MQVSNKKLKTAIIVLSILLGVSVLALGVMTAYRYMTADRPATVVVPDNLIDPEPEIENGYFAVVGNESGGMSSLSASESITNNAVNANMLTLHSRKPEDNTPFRVQNMFPGDAETKYYCVRISHKGDIVLRFHADIREGSEKLAEVLKVKVRLLDTDETLYEGLMRDMPESLNHTFEANQSKQSEAYYKITAYLDTSVGNEYADKSLTADFRWWVEETDNLIPPNTGDTSNRTLLVCLAAGSLLMIIILLFVRRKEEKRHA